MTTDHYVAMLDVFLYGRVVRRTLDPARWRAFKFSVAEKVHSHGVTFEYTARFHVGIGTRPDLRGSTGPTGPGRQRQASGR